MSRRIRHTLNAMIYRAPDVPGQWIAHCLELDMVTQGNDPVHALDMIAEAVEMCAEDNLRAGRPPFDFRSAPAEIWHMFAHGEEAAIRPLKIEDNSDLQGDVTITPSVARAG